MQWDWKPKALGVYVFFVLVLFCNGFGNHTDSGKLQHIMKVEQQKIIEKNIIYRRICRLINCENRNQKRSGFNSKVYSLPSDLSNDTSCMKFSLPDINARTNVIRSAQLNVFVRFRKRHKKGKNRRRRWRRKRITLQINILTRDGIQKNLSRAIHKIFKSKYYTVNLPIQKLKNRYSGKDLNICLTCVGCNRKTSVIYFSTRRRRKSKRVIRKRNPYILFSKNSV